MMLLHNSSYIIGYIIIILIQLHLAATLNSHIFNVIIFLIKSQGSQLANPKEKQDVGKR